MFTQYAPSDRRTSTSAPNRLRGTAPQPRARRLPRPSSARPSGSSSSSRRASRRWSDAPRLVSSDASPTRPEWAVTGSTPAARAAALNRSLTIFGESGTTRSSRPFPGPGGARRRGGPGSTPRPPLSPRSPAPGPGRGARRGRRPTSRPRAAGRRARRRGGGAPRITPGGCSGRARSPRGDARSASGRSIKDPRRRLRAALCDAADEPAGREPPGRRRAGRQTRAASAGRHPRDPEGERRRTCGRM